ncbi:MAG TPA: hypothetical protein VK038_09455, partial [Ornithinicoccus sp.]|nr:hypothetical protein [Ornithinicoccus sp.]
TANDFCPTLAADGKTFYFVSTRPGHCGDTANGDIYRARMSSKHRFSGITHLGCKVNSPYDEHSPFPITLGKQSWLYFSSARAASATDAPGDHDIYAAKRQGQRYGKPGLVRGVNTAFQDGQPNVSRNGRELYFYSNRPGTIGEADIYVATRKNTKAAWSTPRNLGPKVNSKAAETRPSLSWDGRTLYFGTTREGSSDIYVTQRSGR